jgi:hypothetical protein
VQCEVYGHSKTGGWIPPTMTIKCRDDSSIGTMAGDRDDDVGC